MTSSPHPKKFLWVDVGCILLIGLLAVNWFRPGYLIKTEDIALPFDSHRWWQYAHAWNHLIDLGIQFWENFASLIFLALPATLRALGMSMALAQRVQYAVWFTLPGLSMYFLMTRVAPGPLARAARLVAAVFYMANLYLEPLWQGLNIANLSAYAALPALLGCLIQGISPPCRWRTIPIMGLLSLAASGVATNPPLLMVSLLPVLLYILFDLVHHRRWRHRQDLAAIGRYLCGLCLVVALVNSFWMIPQFAAFQKQGGPAASFDQATTIDIARSWLKGVSAGTSTLNVWRLQGHWVWHEDRGDDPYTPYARNFETNFWLLGASFLLPAMVWGVCLGVCSAHQWFFATLAFIGLLFGMGTHPPYGWFYDWLVRHVPFFWIIRSPWYKFSLLTCLGYAVLLGTFANSAYHWFQRRIARRPWRSVSPSTLAMGIPVGIVLLSLAYAYPVSLGKMYPTSHERNHLPPSHIQIPSYVLTTASWISQQPWIRRLLILPEQRVFATTWGYTDYMPPLTYFLKTPLVFNFGRAGWVATETGRVVSVIQEALREGRTRQLQQLLALLNVDAVLLAHDVITLYVDPEDVPDKLAFKLEQQMGIEATHTTGPLTVYRVTQRLPQCFVAHDVTLVEGDVGVLPTLVNAELMEPPAILFASQLQAETLRHLWGQGMVRRVVCFNTQFETLVRRFPFLQQNEAAQPLPDLHLIYTSDQMEIILEGTPADLSHSVVGLSPPQKWHGQAWQWLRTNNEPNIVVDNHTPWPRCGNLAFQVYAYGRPRSLYTYLNGAKVSIQPVPQDGIVKVRLPRLRFQPGRNVVAFYAPEAHDALDGLSVNFALREIHLWAPRLSQQVIIPYEGMYQFRWYLESTPDEPDDRFLETAWVGQHPLVVRRTLLADRPAFVSNTIRLTQGTYAVRCEPVMGGRFALHIAREPQHLTASQQPIAAIACQSVSPTRYELQGPRIDAGLVVFNEGADPGWRLALDSGVVQQPIVVNGCVNGYVVSTPTDLRGHLEFIPQRLFVIGSGLSAVAAIACVLALTGIWRHRAPRKNPCR